MTRCPITYEHAPNSKYSKAGLALLSKKLTHLIDFPYSAQEQLKLANTYAQKLSIQGVQPKLSANLNLTTSSFEIVANNGHYIVKPPHHFFEQLPQNEDLTMKLAKICQIETPIHGMFYNADQTLSYFIKRFDREEKKTKLSVEDFSQLMGCTRDTKYEGSIEKIIKTLEMFCTFPSIEKTKLLRLIIFNYLVGNEDMHLKNFSLITRNNIIELSPSYDLINTTIVLDAKEELALPLNGKKNKFKKSDFLEYLAIKKLGLTTTSIDLVLSNFTNAFSLWDDLISKSFLSEQKKTDYKDLIIKRKKLLDLF